MAKPMSQDLRDLIERNSAVQEMAQHPGWEFYVDYLQDRMFKEQRSLILGNADSMEEYRQMTGLVQGLTYATAAPKALADQVEREEQKEREQND